MRDVRRELVLHAGGFLGVRNDLLVRTLVVVVLLIVDRVGDKILRVFVKLVYRELDGVACIVAAVSECSSVPDRTVRPKHPVVLGRMDHPRKYRRNVDTVEVLVFEFGTRRVVMVDDLSARIE